MNPLDSMRKQMSATGLYALSGTTLVDAELRAYAAGLAAAAAAVEELQREMFVQTAESYGLALRERLFALPAQEDTARRRAALAALGAVTPRGFTRKAIEETLCGVGILCELCENTQDRLVYLNMLSEGDAQQARTQKAEAAGKFLPANLGAELDFRSISWNNIDQTGGTFDELDAKGLSWDSIDEYENALLRI